MTKKGSQSVRNGIMRQLYMSSELEPLLEKLIIEQSTDPQEWAYAFYKTFQGRALDMHDLIPWFAEAILRGAGIRNARHERKAEELKAKIGEEYPPEGTIESMALCVKTIRTYVLPEFPANSSGQVDFIRVVLETCADEIEAFLEKNRSIIERNVFSTERAVDVDAFASRMVSHALNLIHSQDAEVAQKTRAEIDRLHMDEVQHEAAFEAWDSNTNLPYSNNCSCGNKTTKR